MKARWWLDLVPWCMRTWPGVRRYYWQQADIDWSKKEADRIGKFLNDPQR